MRLWPRREDWHWVCCWMRRRSREVVGRGRMVSFHFCFLFFHPQLMFATLPPCSSPRSWRGGARAWWARPLIVPRNGGGGCRGSRGGHTTASHGRRWQAVRVVVRFLFVFFFWGPISSHALLPRWQCRRTAARLWQVECVARAIPAGPLHRRRGSEEGAPILPSPSRRGRWDKESASSAPSSLPRR